MSPAQKRDDEAEGSPSRDGANGQELSESVSGAVRHQPPAGKSTVQRKPSGRSHSRTPIPSNGKLALNSAGAIRQAKARSMAVNRDWKVEVRGLTLEAEVGFRSPASNI